MPDDFHAIEYGLPFAEYAMWRGLSPSKVKLARESLLKFRWAEVNPDDAKPSPAMMLGSAVHCAVLEPTAFKQRYAIYEGERRGKAWQQFAEDNAALTIITQTEANKAQAVARGVYANPIAGQLLTPVEVVEVSMRWIDPDTGMKCKGRPDAVSRTKGMIDLKTISRLDARTIQRNMIDFDYALQLAAYVEGWFRNTQEVLPVSIIFVETSPPFDCAVVDFAEWHTVGDAMWHDTLKRIKAARDADHYPGLAWDGPLEVTPPDWYVEQSMPVIMED